MVRLIALIGSTVVPRVPAPFRIPDQYVAVEPFLSFLAHLIFLSVISPAVFQPSGLHSSWTSIHRSPVAYACG